MALNIGIIVPIYNVSQYLRQCLEGILAQSYQNFEVILVDDGSTDYNNDNVAESLKIALEFVAKDERFRLISKANGGLSSARNAGLWYFKMAKSGECDLSTISKKSAESQKDSNNLAESPSDSSDFTESHSDDCLLSSLRGRSPKQSIKDSAKSSDFVDSSNFAESIESTKDSSDFKGFNDSITQNPALKISEDSSDFAGSPKDSTFCVESRLYYNGSKSHITLYHNAKATPFPRSKIDYIAFLDSDDFWENNLLDECVKCADNADIIWFGFKTHNGAFKNDVLDAFGYKEITTITAKDWLKRLGEVGSGQFWFSWIGIIRFEFLVAIDLKFMEGIIYEDEIFGVLLFSQSRSIVAIPKKFYIYRIRANSITTFSQNRQESLPLYLSHLQRHFSSVGTAWRYIGVSSWCKIIIAFLDFVETCDDRAIADLCKERFLPTFLARSCEILSFKNDIYALKPRIEGILAEYKANLSLLKIIANIIPMRFKRVRYTIFLAYFAPNLVAFRIKKRLKLRGIFG